MTAKRFRKLYMAEVAKAMHGKPGVARSLKFIAQFKISNTKGFSSYQEAWDVLRGLFTYGGNVPPVK